MNYNSLAFRLFISSTILAIIILSAAAFLLISQYRSAIELNFDERLKANLSLLIERSLDEDYSEPRQPDSLGSLAFTLLNSGWYWQIEPVEKTDDAKIFKSKSVGDRPLRIGERRNIVNAPDGTVKFYIRDREGRRLRMIQRILNLGTEVDQKQYRYLVSGDSTEIDDEVIDFAYMLSLVFLILGAGLIAATILQVRFGLQPLRVIERGLAAVRAGKTDRLEGNFPAEIAPLQKEINTLIESNFSVINRARTHVGNLAHALKTPLSVIRNEANSQSGEFAEKISEQTSLMQNQITHHLERAQIAARVGIVSGVTDILPILESLERALQRIYQEKKLDFTLNHPQEVNFAGEKQDFEEIIGNLLDNAFKWADSKVICSVSIERHELEVSNIIIRIEDDGPGLSKIERRDVLQRGKRLDESKPGSGLGLAIVADLVDLYKGRFELKKSTIGGLSAEIQLPAVT